MKNTCISISSLLSNSAKKSELDLIENPPPFSLFLLTDVDNNR